MIARRTFVAASLALLVGGPARAAIVGADLLPASGDRTEALRVALARAVAEKRPLVLAPGTYQIAGLDLPDGAQIFGTAGLTTLVLSERGPLVSAAGAKRIVLSGLSFDGRDRPLPPAGALLAFADVTDLRLIDCIVGRSSGVGIQLDRCGGRIEKCTVGSIASFGIFARDSRALTIADDTVADCGEGGILVHRSTPGEDGTVVNGNRVERIRATSGGSGQYGNGINVFRAHDVTIGHNRVTDCAFSAIRVNGGSNVRIVANEALRSGETALYVEFAFTGAVVSDNIIDGAANGISVVNFMQGGRLAVISGNLVRNLRATGPTPSDQPSFGFGIAVEADTTVSGNVVEGAPLYGITAGWGEYLRDVVISGNIVRDAGVGIAVSVVETSGAAVITGNLVDGARGGAIVGYRWAKPATGDLALPGANVPAHLTIALNRVVLRAK